MQGTTVSEGYIKLYRKIENSPVFENPYYLKLWVAMLLTAQYQEKKVLYMNHEITLKPGQFIFGAPSWSKRLRVPKTTIQRGGEYMTKAGMISVISTHPRVGTIYQIKNWSKYQDSEDSLGMYPGRVWAENGQSPGNEQERKEGKKKEKIYKREKIPPNPRRQDYDDDLSYEKDINVWEESTGKTHSSRIHLKVTK